MEALTSALDAFLSFNWEPLFQLTFVGLILLAGPVVVAVLALRGGDL